MMDNHHSIRELKRPRDKKYPVDPTPKRLIKFYRLVPVLAVAPRETEWMVIESQMLQRSERSRLGSHH